MLSVHSNWLLAFAITAAVLDPAAAGTTVRPLPNIVMFLTDDQDQMLGGSFPAHDGATPMPKTKAKMQDAGAMATNFFIHTPICCPSRSELVTGRYLHNLKTDPTLPKQKDEIICMHVNETKVNGHTFAVPLAKAGYKVGLFGKYLNNMPANHAAPPGFDAWMGNGGGDYIAPAFDTAGLADIGPWHIPDGRWATTEANYTTAVVGNVSIAWIEKTVAAGDPFFAYIAPKAAHEPFIPAPWYLEHWDPSWPKTEPRNDPAWNSTADARAGHHGNIATQPMLSEEAAQVITGVFKNRWRTLMSVDDVIGSVIDKCEALGVLNNTYFFYSSDHGFQLGQLNIIMDKRHVYDWDTRIHLLARGPGIAAGSTWAQPATQVDLAPTFLGIAGLDKTAVMDGKSLLPLLLAARGDTELGAPAAATVHPATARHLASLGDATAYASAWRDAAYIEYYYVAANVKCVEQCTTPGGKYPHSDSWCTDLPDNSKCWGPPCKQDCYPTEDQDNNFIGLRSMPGSALGDTLYVEFQHGNADQGPVNFSASSINFHEVYDVAADKWQMHNLYNSTAPATLQAMHTKLHAFFDCAGDACP